MKYLSLLTLFAFAVQAADYLPKDKVLDGFVHRQKAPQMAGPVPYEPKSKLFHGKRGKLKDQAEKKKQAKKKSGKKVKKGKKK